ncbi:class I adenylate-forming enzyme family protein [Tsuneonella sp. HG222]
MFEHLITDSRMPGSLAFSIGKRRLLTYRQMSEDISSCAAWLGRQRIGQHARAILQLSDPYFHWVFFFALEAHGIVIVPESCATAIDETYIRWSGADIVFSSEPKPKLDGLRWLKITNEFRVVLQALRAQPLPRRKRREEDSICIIRSSGTTGRPKKVMLTRGLLDLRTLHARDAEFLRPLARLECLLPYQSIGGILAALQTWLVEGTVMFSRDHERAGEISAGNINNIVAAPIHLERILDQLPDQMQRPEALTIFCGGATPSATLRARLESQLTSDIITSYGTTETGLVTKGVREAGSDSRENAGRVLPWMKVEVLAVDGSVLGADEEGELRIAGEDVVTGYSESPEETSRYFRSGWYHPGDLGILDKEGRLAITGRVDDIINIDGRKALAADIESLAMTIAEVRDAAAFSVLSRKGHRELWIAYRSRVEVKQDEFIRVIPAFPNIKPVRLEAIPRNAMGKTERAALRRAAQNGQIEPQGA